MYIALGIMLCGMLAGRLLRGRLRPEALRRWIFLAIMLLLFFLGIAVGGNAQLVRDLPHLGGAALALARGGIGGTLVCAVLLRRVFGGGRGDRPHGDGRPQGRDGAPA